MDAPQTVPPKDDNDMNTFPRPMPRSQSMRTMSQYSIHHPVSPAVPGPPPIAPASPPSPFISPFLSTDLSESDLSGTASAYYNYKQNDPSTKLSKDAASKFVKNGMRINNQIERYDTECDHGITAIKFHPFRDILYCADANGRVWVWKYESNIGANNPQNKRRINLVNIKDLHLSNAPLLGSARAANSSQRTPSTTTSTGGYNLRSKLKGGHSQSIGHFPDTTTPGDGAHDHDRVVVTSFEIINEYHDTMLLCAGDDGTVRIYRNSHLENCMSAVTAFLANGRIKAPRSTHFHSSQKDGGHYSSWSSGQMLTSWCSEFGYLYTGGSHNSIKVKGISACTFYRGICMEII